MVELTLVLGSTSDWNNIPEIKESLREATLDRKDLKVKVAFASAHNTPELVPKAVGNSRARMSGAGMSAALPGIIEACYCDLSQISIGVPLSDSYFGGLPAFLSIAEMPPNNPVICTGINNVGALAHIAYEIETRKFKHIVLCCEPGADEGLKSLKKKLDEILGSDNRMYEIIGEVPAGKQPAPELVAGNLVLAVYRTVGYVEESGHSGIDRILSEQGGIQIAVKQGIKEESLAYRAAAYADQFRFCGATGTVAVGSAGYTNAAHLGARITGRFEGMDIIAKAKEKKKSELSCAPGYIVESGIASEIEQPQTLFDSPVNHGWRKIK